MKPTEASRATLLRALIQSFVRESTLEEVLAGYPSDYRPGPAWNDLVEKLMLAVQLQEEKTVGGIADLIASREDKPRCFGHFGVYLHPCRVCLWGIDCRNEEIASIHSWHPRKRDEDPA